jgi:hypothetical protein
MPYKETIELELRLAIVKELLNKLIPLRYCRQSECMILTYCTCA